jgi:UDP-N-acetylmuramoyl-L-alanyl-D-glutamate--2,6-diaminopimelate ligase
MEFIEVKQGPIVIVDYAHTPDALEKALLACREHLKDGAVSVLFGCGGDRDQGKRPLMAQVAASYADSVWVTSDNPRTENPQAIVDQIMTGFASQESVKQVLGRADAIDLAIAAANEGDIVLLAGKGHEEYQEINGERLPFSDQAQARRALAAGGWL